LVTRRKPISLSNSQLAQVMMRNSFRRLRLTRVNGAFGPLRLLISDFFMVKEGSGVDSSNEAAASSGKRPLPMGNASPLNS
jgi:hypothetical protein